jgi:hypothetical protein
MQTHMRVSSWLSRELSAHLPHPHPVDLKILSGDPLRPGCPFGGRRVGSRSMQRLGVLSSPMGLGGYGISQPWWSQDRSPVNGGGWKWSWDCIESSTGPSLNVPEGPPPTGANNMGLQVAPWETLMPRQ